MSAITTSQVGNSFHCILIPSLAIGQRGKNFDGWKIINPSSNFVCVGVIDFVSTLLNLFYSNSDIRYSLIGSLDQVVGYYSLDQVVGSISFKVHFNFSFSNIPNKGKIAAFQTVEWLDIRVS